MTEVADSREQRGCLVDDDPARRRFRVHAAAYASEDVYARERARFARSHWLYLGHETEVREPGDFVVRELLGRSLILCRDGVGELHVFLNSCPHKGTVVCREERGNSRHFTCFYHGFTFDNAGQLVAFPGKDDPTVYDPEYRSEMGLRAVPRVDSYRGFIFIAFDSSVPTLREHLAGAMESLDLIDDQGADGMEVVEGTHLYASNTNWKLAVENALDNAHFAPTHSTFVEWRKTTGFVVDGQGSWRELGNGHIVAESSGFYGRAGLSWEPAWGEAERDRIEEARLALAERVGPERADRIANRSRNTFIFPNLIVFDFIGVSLRVLEPISAGLTDIRAYEMALVGEDPGARRHRLDSLLTFVGPGGFATPDDLEAQQLAQTGHFANLRDPRPEVPWSDVSRGYSGELDGHEDGSDLYNEANLRAFWRHWQTWLDAPLEDESR